MAYWRRRAPERDKSLELWKLFGPVALTLVLSMAGTYFIFLQNMVPKQDIERTTELIRRQIADLSVAVHSIESTTVQRGPLVGEIPGFRQELVKLAVEAKAQQIQIDNLKLAMAQLREDIKKSASPGQFNVFETPPDLWLHY